MKTLPTALFSLFLLLSIHTAQAYVPDAGLDALVARARAQSDMDTRDELLTDFAESHIDTMTVGNARTLALNCYHPHHRDEILIHYARTQAHRINVLSDVRALAQDCVYDEDHDLILVTFAQTQNTRLTGGQMWALAYECRYVTNRDAILLLPVGR